MFKRAQQKRRFTLRANIKERWFLLTSKALFYFELIKGEKGKLKGTIALDTISAVEPLPAADGSSVWMLEVRFRVEICKVILMTAKIVHAAAILYCQTDSKDDRNAWVSAIRGAVPKLSARRTPQTPRSDALSAL
jgi:hypothetical protein